MKMRLVAFGVCAAFFAQAHGFEIKSPDDLQDEASFSILSPDRHIETLGKVTYMLDLAASHDDVLSLKVRRSSLSLADGRPFRAFGVHKDANLIVIAGGRATHVSITNAHHDQLQVIFYDKDNQVIAPAPEDIAVFDTAFNPVSFAYKPLVPPRGINIPVSIAIDTSGSMGPYMDDVLHATRRFMETLPSFTSCQIISFADTLTYHSGNSAQAYAHPCPQSPYLLSSLPEAGGATALYQAVYASMPDDALKGDYPPLSIIITDGLNSVQHFDAPLTQIADKKARSKSKIFVFWIGGTFWGTLSAVADKELMSVGALGPELEQFFTALGISLSGMQSLDLQR